MSNYEKLNKINKIYNGDLDFIVGTHALFQDKIKFKKLGLIIIDEQHKFGVKQRMKLSQKGGDNCDVLLMSATPIPRSMMLANYGDLDLTTIKQNQKTEKILNNK